MAFRCLVPALVLLPASCGLTDGVWLDQRGDARFPQGVFYASHLDLGVVAFDWRDIAAALELPECRR